MEVETMDVDTQVTIVHEEAAAGSAVEETESDIGKTIDGNFVCGLCAQLFKSRAKCASHLSSVHGKEECDEVEEIVPHLCPHCGASFRFKGNLVKHIRSAHQVEPEDIEEKGENFVCSYCDAPFTSISNLNRHCRTKHCDSDVVQKPVGVSKPVYCPMCKQKFCNEASLQCHTRVFHKIVMVSSGSSHNRKMRRKFYQFSCKICNLKLNKRFNMHRHVVSQHGVEPNNESMSLIVTYVHQDIKQAIDTFHCQDCMVDFAEEAAWETHMKDVHDLQPETCCSVCGEHSFQFMKDLQTHMNEAHNIPPVVIDEDRQLVRLHGSTLGLSDSEMHALAKVPEWLVKRGGGKLVIAVYRS